MNTAPPTAQKKGLSDEIPGKPAPVAQRRLLVQWGPAHSILTGRTASAGGTLRPSSLRAPSWRLASGWIMPRLPLVTSRPRLKPPRRRRLVAKLLQSHTLLPPTAIRFLTTRTLPKTRLAAFCLLHLPDERHLRHHPRGDAQTHGPILHSFCCDHSLSRSLRLPMMLR